MSESSSAIEAGSTYFKDTSKPDGDTCSEDGTLKDASDDEQAPCLAPQNATLQLIGHQKANKRLVWTIRALPAVSVAATMSNKSSCISIYHTSKLSRSYVTSAISA